MVNKFNFAVVFFGIAISTLFSQVAGTITGSVKDPAGAVVPGAAIDIFFAGGGKAVLTSKTTSDGLFTISGVRPETYDIHIGAAGFSPYIVKNVKVDPAHETTLEPIKLEVGTVASAVEVSTNAEGVQTSNVRGDQHSLDRNRSRSFQLSIAARLR